MKSTCTFSNFPLVSFAFFLCSTMSKPLIVAKKRKREDETDPVTVDQGSCIICKQHCDEKHTNYSPTLWSEFQDLALKWKGLDKFHDLHDSVDWASGPEDKLWHRHCKANIASSRKLQQARNRKEKECLEMPSEAELPLKLESKTDNDFSTRSKVGKLHDKHLCIWCMLPKDKKHPNRDRFHIIQQKDSWESFKSHTIYLEDFEMRCRILKVIDATPDPFAAEIRYHLSCWKKYVKPVYTTDNLSSEQIHLQNIQRQEVKLMFTKHVKTAIFDNGKPRTLKGLLQDYTKLLQNFGLEGSGVKSSTIKEILLAEFGSKIGFHDRFHKNKSTIVYDKDAGGSYVEAAINCWGIDNDDLLNIVARKIRTSVQGEKPLAWPPYVDQLTNSEEPPLLLRKLVTWLRSPTVNTFDGPVDNPVIRSISSILEGLITRQRTSFQTQLAITMHGLTRSREIIDLLKSFGLGISYNDVLSLHEAWAKHEIEKSKICPDEIADGYPATVIVDNDDFKDDDLTGGTTSHRTNMMYVQPEPLKINNAYNKRPALSFPEKSELKDMCMSEHRITPYKTIKRGEPKVRSEVDVQPSDTTEQRKRLFTHSLARVKDDGTCNEAASQLIGTFGGFCAGIRASGVKSKPYYFLTFPKPPHKTVLNAVLEKAAAAANLKNMPFIQVVGDQPVYALMVQLKYENLEKFQPVIPVLGAFHAQMSFIAAINKRTKDCGIADLVVGGGVIAEGSVDQALRGKHFNRAIRIFKLVYEVLARRLMRKGHEEGIRFSDSRLAITRDPNNYPSNERNQSFEGLLSSEKLSSYVKSLFEMVEKSASSMAMFWVSIMNMIEILLMNIYSLRTKDWPAFKTSLRLMLPWLTIYDNDKYSRWLAEYWLEISTLPEEHDALMSQLFAQSMTGKPYSDIPLDLWIECTMNKGSKLKAGWKRLLKNEKGLLSHVKNANNVNAVRDSLHRMADKRNTVSKFHKENSKLRLSTDEQAIQDMDCLIDEYDCDPFDFSKPELRSLQSGLLASAPLVKDFETAVTDGEAALTSFMRERMFAKEKSFNDPIHRKSRCSFGKPPATDDRQGRVMKSDAMENRAMSEAVGLAEKHPNFSLSSLFENRVTKECLAIFNINGTLRKCQKSMLVHQMTFTELQIGENYTALIDIGFLWRKCAPSVEDREKDDESKYTWFDWSQRIFSTVCQRHKNAGTIVFVNDCYEDGIVNIKDCEHAKRSGSSYIGGSRNIYPLKDGKFPTKREFDHMFANKGNKRRIQSFLKQEFAALAEAREVKVIYSVRDKCEDISVSPHRRIADYECEHSEADTILLHIYSKMRSMGITNDVVVDAEDTDVVVMCAYAAHKINGTLGLKRQGSVYDCRELCTKEMADVIIPLHANSGADAISSFFGQGKKAIFDRVAKSSNFKSLLSSVGKALPVSDRTVKDLEVFTIKCVYNDKTSKSLGEARAKKWSTMKRKSTARLPPDEESHYLRALRVAYQAYIWLHFDIPDAPPSPLQYGWQILDGKCVPVRYRSAALPPELTITRDRCPQDSDASDDESDTDSDESTSCDEDSESEDN